MEAFFLIDKAKGVNSFKLVIALRKKLAEKSIGYAGTLDPLATGLMLVATGAYTKLLPYLEVRDKVYQVKIRLGAISETMDADGPISEVDPNLYTKPEAAFLNKLIEQNFLGKIKQIPPKHSAIQIEGKRAYDLARKGHKFELKPREVEIFSLQINQYQFPILEMTVHCSSGTYIRSLAHDIGQLVGCGGYVEELRRLKIANLSVDNAITLEEILAENWSDKAVREELVFPEAFWLDLEEKDYDVLAKGNFIEADKSLLAEVGNKFILATFKGKLVGVVEFTEGFSKLKFKKKFNIVISN